MLEKMRWKSAWDLSPVNRTFAPFPMPSLAVKCLRLCPAWSAPCIGFGVARVDFAVKHGKWLFQWHSSRNVLVFSRPWSNTVGDIRWGSSCPTLSRKETILTNIAYVLLCDSRLPDFTILPPSPLGRHHRTLQKRKDWWNCLSNLAEPIRPMTGLVFGLAGCSTHLPHWYSIIGLP